MPIQITALWIDGALQDISTGEVTHPLPATGIDIIVRTSLATNGWSASIVGESAGLPNISPGAGLPPDLSKRHWGGYPIHGDDQVLQVVEASNNDSDQLILHLPLVVASPEDEEMH